LVRVGNASRQRVERNFLQPFFQVSVGAFTHHGNYWRLLATSTVIFTCQAFALQLIATSIAQLQFGAFVEEQKRAFYREQLGKDGCEVKFLLQKISLLCRPI
jgi:hypothetical protein